MASEVLMRAADADVQLTYAREADAIYVRFRVLGEVERTEDLGDGRVVEYAGGQPVGIKLSHVHQGVRFEGLPRPLLAVAAGAVAFAASLFAADDPPYEPQHPAVRATAGVAAREAGAPSSLEALRRNAREYRSEQLLQQS